jgi:hypothetical protein
MQVAAAEPTKEQIQQYVQQLTDEYQMYHKMFQQGMVHQQRIGMNFWKRFQTIFNTSCISASLALLINFLKSNDISVNIFKQLIATREGKVLVAIASLFNLQQLLYAVGDVQALGENSRELMVIKDRIQDIENVLQKSQLIK